MIRKLRWKVVAITMLFVTAILLSVFTGVYITARNNLNNRKVKSFCKVIVTGIVSRYSHDSTCTVCHKNII